MYNPFKISNKLDIFIHHSPHLINVKRLRQILIHPSLVHLLDILIEGIGRSRTDRHRREELLRYLLFDVLRGLVAVHHRHVAVHED